MRLGDAGSRYFHDEDDEGKKKTSVANTENWVYYIFPQQCLHLILPR